MKIQRLSTIGFLITSLSCTQTEVKPVIDYDVGLGGQSSTYYPYVSASSSSTAEQPQQDFWDCGVDYITTQGPDGQTIIVEVRIPCDPLADLYKGCPAPMNEQ